MALRPTVGLSTCADPGARFTGPGGSPGWRSLARSSPGGSKGAHRQGVHVGNAPDPDPAVIRLDPGVLRQTPGSARAGSPIDILYDIKTVPGEARRCRAISPDNAVFPGERSLFRFRLIPGTVRRAVAILPQRYESPSSRSPGLAAILADRKRLYETAKQACPKRWSGDTRNWAPINEV